MSGWTIPLDRLIAKAQGNLELVARKTILTCYRRVIMRTPVKTGRARGNWFCAIGAAPSQTTDQVDPSGRSSAGDMQQTVAGQWKPLTGETCIMSNNLPYIGRLEEGSSKQAPGGMVKLTVAEMGGIAQDAASGGVDG